MGEDWNGAGGGNSDRGDPVYSTAHGVVVLARDVRMGWGNLVIIRHLYREGKQLKTVDSVYAHLGRISVKEGQQVRRGDKVGTIGTNRGMYTAHLHFEIRKNLHIGFNQRGFSRDLRNYHVPGAFIHARRQLPGGNRSGIVTVNTFNLPSSAGHALRSPELKSKKRRAEKPKEFRVKRF